MIWGLEQGKIRGLGLVGWLLSQKWDIYCKWFQQWDQLWGFDMWISMWINFGEEGFGEEKAGGIEVWISGGEVIDNKRDEVWDF